MEIYKYLKILIFFLTFLLHSLVKFMIKHALKNINLIIFFAKQDIPWFTKSLKKAYKKNKSCI